MTQPTWWVNDRLPSISDQLTIEGDPVDLAAADVQFKMRQVGGTAIKVDQPVTTKDAQGNWRYDWTTGDLDTAGQWLTWLEVTTSGKVQTLWESLIEVRAHDSGWNYAELEQVRNSLGVSEGYLDANVTLNIAAASRAIDEATGRRFYLDPADSVRYYEPKSYRLVALDDAVSITEVAIDRTGGGFTEVWDTGDYVLEPYNALLEYWPYEWLRRSRLGGRDFPCLERSVRVTGRFGWPQIPAPIVEATQILAIKLLKRTREAPFGIVTPGMDVAFRIARTDPDVGSLIAPYSRKAPFAV
jgi:hypothetical protein